jgi:hypothetical protein
MVALDGSAISPELMRGSPWVITAWLPGCAPCAKEIPEVEALRAEYEPRGVKFLALSVDADADNARLWAPRMGLSMRVATASGPVLDPLGLRGVPATLVISKDGRISARGSGPRSRGFLQRRVAELLSLGEAP